MDSREKIVEKVQDALKDITGNDDIVLEESNGAKDIRGWDSLANVRLFVELEGVFGIRFSAIEIERMQTVGDIVDSIVDR